MIVMRSAQFVKLAQKQLRYGMAIPQSITLMQLFLPGGFSYGDYLRCGAISRFAPVMTD
jgi:phosphoribosylformylglycinamidine (FGAM) synthase-like amidotransferase family enzyme